MKNIFDNPKEYIKYINNIEIPEKERRTFVGKSIVFVWLTKFCVASCEHCFSKSNMLKNNKYSELNEFSKVGIEKLIEFTMKPNLPGSQKSANFPQQT